MSNVLARSIERLHYVSRVLYAPALAAFTSEWLADLAQQRDGVALCLGRDGLSAFLAGRILLRMNAQQFGGLSPRRVRLAYVSRAYAAAAVGQPQQAALLDRYLQGQGIDHHKTLTLVDVGIHGSIQNALQQLYPNRRVSGRYLLLRRRANDPYGTAKQGFLAEVDVAPRLPVVVAPSWSPQSDLEVGGTLRRGYPVFLRRQSVYVFEDMWNGVSYGADAWHVLASGTVGVRRQRLDKVVSLPPGPHASPREQMVLKRTALRGVAEGVARVAQRGLTPDAAHIAIDDLASWFEQLEDPDPVDAALLDLLVRHRPHRTEHVLDDEG